MFASIRKVTLAAVAFGGLFALGTSQAKADYFDVVVGGPFGSVAVDVAPVVAPYPVVSSSVVVSRPSVVVDPYYTPFVSPVVSTPVVTRSVVVPSRRIVTPRIRTVSRRVYVW
ncbi:MAG: hypothetical protein AAF539_05310 [Planctomycetota bacterium]